MHIHKSKLSQAPHPPPKSLGATLFALLLLMSGCALAQAEAEASPFKRIFVFGDSLSDVGRMFALTSGYPPAPYDNGRFSNGQVWIEYLADALGVVVPPEDNFAVGGATTGRANWMETVVPGSDFPGLQDEIDWFEASSSKASASQALFVVWAGANDFFVSGVNGTAPEVVIREAVANTITAVTRLKQCGAHCILLGNLPDLGVTPLAIGSGNGAGLSQLSAAYNAALAAALDPSTPPAVSVIRFDGFAALDAMFYHPSDFGFINVTDPLIQTGSMSEPYLFWDEVHPTTAAHAALAEAAEQALLNACQDLPPAACHGLRGLLRANKSR